MGRIVRLMVCACSLLRLPAICPPAAHRPPPKAQADAGKLVLWGSVGRPASGGMLIWRGADEAEVAAWVKQDPLVANGHVRHW